MVVRSIVIKVEAKNVFWSKNQRWITLQWILQSILENQTLQRTAKLIIWLIMVDFYGMDFMKGIGSKIRWDVQYLQVYYPLFIGREIKMELDDQSFCWSLPLNVHTFTTPLLYQGEASSCKRYSCRENFWYYNIDDTGAC